MLDPQNPSEGIYENVPERIYRSAAGISQSELKEMDPTPAHYHAAKIGTKKDPTPDQLTGTLTHALILQQKELFVVIPSDAPKIPTKAQINAKKPSEDTKDSIAWWNQFRNSNPGREYLDREDADRLYAMRDSVRRHPTANEILSRATAFEVAAFKRHKTGLMMKGLADCLAMDDKNLMVIPDLKTTQPGGASESEFSRSIFNWGYDQQAAYYLDLFGATYFMFIAVEKEPPYAVACYNLDAQSIQRGRDKNEAALLTIAECEKSGVWPAYHSGIKTIGLPEWVIRKGL